MPNNTVPISFKLTNLIKRLNYTFTVEGLGGNWPATITPASGEFTAIAKTGSIDATVSFCATTGVCIGDTDILPYDMAKKCTFDQSQIFTFVRMKATLDDDPSVFVYSNPVRVDCSTCLPKASVIVPPQVNLYNTTGNGYNFTAEIIGLIPKETYNFSYSSIDGNWPVKMYPASGSFTPSTSSFILPSRVIFCNSTGVCAPGTDNVLEYDLDPSCLTQSYFSSLQLNVSPESCSYDDAQSNIMHVRCDNCLPIPVVAMPYRLSLTNQTNHYADFTTIVSGIIPNRTYSYNFRTLDANWPIYMENTTGLFSSPIDSYCIESRAEFCVHSGTCLNGQPNILDHTILDNCFIRPQDYEARIIVDISSEDCGDTLVSSNIMNLSCKNCFPDPIDIKLINISTGSANSDNPVLYVNKGEFIQFATKITNLKPHKFYNYSIESLYSNWPVFADKASGFIQTNDNTTYDLLTNISFCESEASCPSGYKGVLNYTLTDDDIPENYNNLFNKYAIIQVKVMDGDCLTNSYVSKRLFLECNNCYEEVRGISLVSINITG